MADETISLSDNGHTEAWQDKPWKQFQKIVFRLQKRIYRASEQGNKRLVHKLQRLLLTSRAAKYLAVRRVSQDNQGKRTPGVDGKASLSPNERVELAENLRLDAKADPIRRVLIPKANEQEFRKLGIPTMRDRAKQALAKLALEPEWEAKFEPNSYGFRPGRSSHDAIAACFLSIKQLPKYVLDADIEKCFDEISHPYLLAKLNTFSTLRRQVRAWLKAGIFTDGLFVRTKAGTPQGGIASPLLMNIALHGLEASLCQSLPLRRKGKTWQPTVIRYADDIAILHRDLNTIHALKTSAEQWLAQVGLRFKNNKTCISHTLNPYHGRVGFDFLGFEVRQYQVGKHYSGKDASGELLGFKTLIKPSKSVQKRHLAISGEWLTKFRGEPQVLILNILNPIIRGWSNYYRHVVATQTFSKLDSCLHHQLKKWAKWRHPKKGYLWRMKRYWRRTSRGIRFTVDKQQLLKHSDTKIHRFVKVKGTKSPYDGDWIYWGLRLKRFEGLSPLNQNLLKKQQGKCLYCGLFFQSDDLLEKHHLDLNRTNNVLKNLALLHRHCHDFVHRTHNKGYSFDKPNKRKRLRSV